MKEWFENRPFQHRRVCALTIHPLIQDMPRLADGDPRYAAMQSAWRESGHVPPICVTPKGAILDGRHRFWFCKSAGIDKIATVEFSEQEASLVVLQSLAGRNHVGKGQRAYLAAPFLKPALEVSRQRRNELRRLGGRVDVPTVTSPEDLAKQMGISERLLWQAVQLHDVLAKDSGLRKRIEPKILADEDPMGLGAALAKIKPATPETPPGKPSEPTPGADLDRFRTSWKTFARRSASCGELAGDRREKMAEIIRDSVASMPRVWVDLVREQIDRVLRESAVE